MKKFKLLLLMILCGLMVNAQNILFVDGVVTYTDGSPASNVDVYIYTDSTASNAGVFHVVQTNPNGYYADSIDVIEIPVNGGVFLYDCNQVQVDEFFIMTSSDHQESFDFQICQSNTPIDSCGAYFTYSVNDLTVDFQDYSVNGESIWEFGDGNYDYTTQNQSVSHIFSSYGTYNVCLIDTLSTGNGCSDVYCESITLVQDTTTNPQDSCYFSFNWSQSQNDLSIDVIAYAQGITINNWVIDNISYGYGNNFTHTFQNEGTHLVCAEYECSGNVMTYCDSVYVGEPQDSTFSSNICGTITKNNTNAQSADVYLIAYDNGTLSIIESATTDANGYYIFYNHPPGSYKIKAELGIGDTEYGQFMPTYYVNSLNWNYGTSMTVTAGGLYVANINLIAGTIVDSTVTGNVIGMAVAEGNFGKSAISGLQINLLDINDHPITYTFTDVNGQYSFNHITPGTYKIYGEAIPKYSTPAIITIGNGETVSGINLKVSDTEIYPQLVGINDVNNSWNSIKFYPNPVSNQLTINTQQLEGSFEISLLNIYGQTVKTQKINSFENVNWNMNEYASGVYLLQLTNITTGAISAQQIVKM